MKNKPTIQPVNCQLSIVNCQLSIVNCQLSIALIALLFVLFFSACKKPNEVENAKLNFSTNLVTFDTVFTSIGSMTQRFTVHNPHNFDVKTNVYLAGANSSFYSINLDGESGQSFKNVEIRAKDSLFIFVKVNVNPGNQNNPFLVTDSIIFQTGTTQQDVDLLAYGQDAHFIVGDSPLDLGGGNIVKYKVIAKEHQTTTWKNDKPYVIYGWAVVDSLGKLIIEAGTKVYFHNGGCLWVYKDGNIQVTGTAEDPVEFQSDRKEAWYDVDYAKWERIWIFEGNEDNLIEHAIISHAFVGIQVEPSQIDAMTRNKTVIRNCIIKNTQHTGILGRRTTLEVENCVIANNGYHALWLGIGSYQLKHLTLGNYYNIYPYRTTPTLLVENVNALSSSHVIVGNTDLYCVNSIITGLETTEFAINQAEEGELNWRMENCILKTEDSIAPQYSNMLFNRDPHFTDPTTVDFTLKENSPAINAGKSEINVLYDITGKMRDDRPDIGAYEY